MRNSKESADPIEDFVHLALVGYVEEQQFAPRTTVSTLAYFFIGVVGCCSSTVDSSRTDALLLVSLGEDGTFILALEGICAQTSLTVATNWFRDPCGTHVVAITLVMLE
mmetsp:Transcript_62271/g.171089  ORF Transcript_62271/g.171089 Transcript_62271/m.171089 type:complete len:109 (-) Transcript_62271:3902-4228(-)